MSPFIKTLYDKIRCMSLELLLRGVGLISASSNKYRYKQNVEVFKQMKQNRSVYNSYTNDVI